MKIDLDELKRDKDKNLKERLKFVKFWVEYMKRVGDEVWSKQQNDLINGQVF